MNKRRFNELKREGLTRKEIAFRMNAALDAMDGDFSDAEVLEKQAIEALLSRGDLPLIPALRRCTTSVKRISELLSVPQWFVDKVLNDCKKRRGRSVDIDFNFVNTRLKQLGYSIMITQMKLFVSGGKRKSTGGKRKSTGGKRKSSRKKAVAKVKAERIVDPRIHDMLEAGLPVKQIMSVTGASRYAVMKGVKGISDPEIRKYASKDALKLNSDQISKLIRYEALGCSSFADLSEMFEVDLRCIKLILLKAGILNTEECRERQSELENGASWEPFQRG